MDIFTSVIDWLESDDMFFLKYGLVLANFMTILIIMLSRRKVQSVIQQNQEVLLVIAHPDDEAMFFLPTIETLKEQSIQNPLNFFKEYNLHLLCLTNGNFENKGNLRESELEKSSKYLGFKSLKIINDPDIQDSMTKDWPIEKVRNYIQEYVTSNNISGLITFDSWGVSGHINHRAVSKAAILIDCPKILQLESVNILRKYSSILDFFVSALKTDLVVIQANPYVAWKAMSIHKSQFVWYRKLFVIFSRYGYINTLIKVK